MSDKPTFLIEQVENGFVIEVTKTEERKLPPTSYIRGPLRLTTRHVADDMDAVIEIIKKEMEE